MSRNDVIMGLVALVLIAFSLVVSLVVPRGRPDFPGRSLRVFVLVAALLVAAMLTSVEVFGESHHGESAKAQEEAVDTGGADTGAVSTAQTGTTPTTQPATSTQATTGATGGGKGDPKAGAAVFQSAGCNGCHTLEAAKATGTVGPNLDQLKPDFQTVVHQVENGGGAMPAFKGQLSQKQIDDVAAYVVASTKG